MSRTINTTLLDQETPSLRCKRRQRDGPWLKKPPHTLPGMPDPQICWWNSLSRFRATLSPMLLNRGQLPHSGVLSPTHAYSGSEESHPVVSNSFATPCAFTLKLTVWEWKTQIPTQSSSSTTSGPRWPNGKALDQLVVHHVGEALPNSPLQRRETPMAEGGQHTKSGNIVSTFCHLRELTAKVEVQEERKWNPLPSNKKAVGYSNKKHGIQCCKPKNLTGVPKPGAEDRCWVWGVQVVEYGPSGWHVLLFCPEYQYFPGC